MTLLSNGKPEVSFCVEIGGLKLKCRADWYVESATQEQVDVFKKYGKALKEDDSFFVDLKTTNCLADWDRLDGGNVAFKLRYHMSAAFYQDVATMALKAQSRKPVKAFAHVVLEKKAPYETAVKFLSHDAIKAGALLSSKAIGELVKWSQKNWRGIANTRNGICDVPEWSK